MANFKHFWTVIQRVMGNQEPGLALDKAMSEHSTSETYLIALAGGDEAVAEMPIGVMWRRLNATQRAIVVAAWTAESDPAKALDRARDMLQEMLREIDFTLAVG